MIDCTFELNNQPMSTLKAGAASFAAFSGLDAHVNKRISACLLGVGPIPPGTYYIFDRQSGGLLEPFRNLFRNHTDWFALYAADGRVDDETYCNQVRRGNFRLHPKGPRGISQGCITIDNQSDFHHIRAMLRGACQANVPGSKLKAYGRVIVT